MGGLIPLSDASRRPSRIPIITALIIVANGLVFVMELANGDAFVNAWSAIPSQVWSGHQWITLITSMFLHGSWSHIIGNMIFLWAFGPEIEDAMGRWRYLVFYFAGGIVAMISQVAVDPQSTLPNLGASGAIAAVMGAFIVTFPRDQIRSVLFFFVFARIAFIPAVLLIGFWFLSQIFDAGTVADVQSGGVAYVAHIGGFIFGVVTARLFESQRRAAWPENEE
jgi:membrane associated rhomboid family serine protease